MPDHEHAWARKAAEEIASEFFPLLRKTYCSNECECEKCDSITSCRVAEQNTTETIFAIILRHVGPIFAEKDARIAALERRLDPKRDTRGQEPVRWVADGEIEFRQEYSKEATP